MAIIHQTDKRSGITYAYETTYRWDPEKKQSRSKRTIIGRVDKATGEIVPTDGRMKKAKSKSETDNPVKKPGPKPVINTRHMYYGATYLLEEMSNDIGLTSDLASCFPNIYQQILSIAFYLILEDNNPLYRFEKWHITHKHPFDEDITSPRSSELFASITDQQINQVFRLQGRRRIKEEYWAYDSSSISSYSETLKQVQYGKNKENDKLPQLNLLLVYGEKSGLPFYYRKLAGNIPDVKTVKHLIGELDILGFNKTKFVMDRGFYSEANINELYKAHVKFLVGVRLSLKFVKQHLNDVYDDIRMFQNFMEDNNTYGVTIPIEWDYSQERPYKGDIITEKRRMYLHLFYNLDKGAEEESVFDKRIAILYRELRDNNPVESHQKDYDKYFFVKTTPKRGITVTPNDHAIREAKRYMGYFALITNETMDAPTALHLYRQKDVVEKAFGNIKERLNMRRLLVSSERSLDGKLFVQFIALILISHLYKKMKDSELINKYSLHQLLDKLDVIECFESPRKALRIGELLNSQIDIYEKLGVRVPSSS